MILFISNYSPNDSLWYTVACKTGFTFTAGTEVLLRHTDQGFA
jgi:hypothetical protein